MIRQHSSDPYGRVTFIPIEGVELELNDCFWAIGQGRNTSLIHRPKHGHLQSLTDTPYSIGMAHQFMKRTPSLTKDRIQVLFWSIDHGKLSSLGSGSPRIGNTTRLGAKKEYTGSMYRYAHSRRSCLKGQMHSTSRNPAVSYYAFENSAKSTRKERWYAGVSQLLYTPQVFLLGWLFTWTVTPSLLLLVIESLKFIVRVWHFWGRKAS